MISMQDVVSDWDLRAPDPFTIQRSVGEFVLGGFKSTTFNIPVFGPVQQVSNKEISMLPEADRVGSILGFWATIQIYVTRGQASVLGTTGEVPTGSGINYTLTTAPPNGVGTLVLNGLLMTPNVDYSLVGTTLTLTTDPGASPKLYFSWPTMVQAEDAASDIIVYDDNHYRILQTYYDPGDGYWKALGTRQEAS